MAFDETAGDAAEEEDDDGCTGPPKLEGEHAGIDEAGEDDSGPPTGLVKLILARCEVGICGLVVRRVLSIVGVDEDG